MDIDLMAESENIIIIIIKAQKRYLKNSKLYTS